MSAFGENYHKNDLVDYIEMFFKDGGTVEDMFDVLKYVFEFGNTPINHLQQELTKYKERNATLLDIIRYYKTTEWGLKSCEILDNFEEILEDKEGK